MKYRTTKKAVMNGYDNVICVGYCDLQHLLNAFGDPVAFTAGTHGWYADVYQITPHTAIVTGYQAFGNIKADYEFDRELNQRIWSYNDWSDKIAAAKIAMKELLEHYGCK